MSDLPTSSHQQGRSRLYPNYAQPELVLVRGRGCELWDADGRRYLDLFAGVAVNSLGHAHPSWVKAVAEQAARLVHVSNHFYNGPNLELAARLCAMASMDRALFCNSGTEAIEASLKLARRYHWAAGQPSRYQILAFEGSFHGRTMGALAATGQPKYREGFGPTPGVLHVPYGDLAAVEAALGPEVAAVLVEPIAGEGGVIPAPAGFLRGLRELTTQRGALLIVDEIQTGCGRTGRFLGLEHAGIQADVVAMAKGLGGGIPIGAMLCREQFASALPPGTHGTTFGGNALACAAALSVLDVLEQEELVAHAARLGAWFGPRLQELVSRHPRVLLGARGMGLLQGVVLRPEYPVAMLLSALREQQVLAIAAGGNVLRLCPPLTITERELEEGLSALDRVLQGLG